VIQALDGTICFEGRPVGEDGTALPGQADGPRSQRQRQPAIRRSDFVDCADGQPVARPACVFREADKTFDSNDIIADLNAHAAKIVISQHPRRILPIPIDTDIYKW